MIKVKFLFSDWHEVSKEQAKEFVKTILSGMTMNGKERKIKYINEHYLRGSTVEELIK